jgi:hypothetical protein
LETRDPSDWQPVDLRRIRYVCSIKRKVMDIAESYGGLSFLPQSFMVSVFLGEATRSSHRVKDELVPRGKQISQNRLTARSRPLAELRRRSRLTMPKEERTELEFGLDEESTPAEHASSHNDIPLTVELPNPNDGYTIGDSLLGPSDVAILLQAGLTSVMKSSTVVQLNQRMLLDLICSQPPSFAVAVLAEIGSFGGTPSPRSLTSALMALLELDQTAFRPNHQIDVHSLVERWLPGLKIPRREDHMAGGRWARQSYYESVFAVASSIIDDAEVYFALKGHLQRVRFHRESDPLPQTTVDLHDIVINDALEERHLSRVQLAFVVAQKLIDEADLTGASILNDLVRNERRTKESETFKKCVRLYQDAFEACAKVQAMDTHAFHAPWFSEFYRRNYDALMVLCLVENVRDNVGDTRHW